MKRLITKTTLEPLRSLWSCVHASTAHRLTTLLILGLLVSAANVFFFRSVLNDIEGMAGTISTAGKLRLLSQKIELDIIELEFNPAGSPVAVLNGVTEFNAVIKALAEGGVVFGANVRPIPERTQPALAEVRARWEEYRDKIIIALRNEGESLVDGQSADAMALRHQLALRSTRLLHSAERMVDAIVKDVQERQRYATLWMYVGLTVLALCFVLIFWFVRNRINRPLRLLEDGMQRLSAGDYQLHMQYGRYDDMGRLITALNNSAQHFDALLHELEYSHASLSRAENMFRGMAEHSSIGVSVHSRSGFLFVNPAMAKMLGYEREEMLAGMKPRDVLAWPESAHLDQRDSSAEVGKSGIASLLQGRRSDGSVIDLEVFESVMPLDGETVTLSVAVDVTERREAEEVMWRQANFDYLTNLPNRKLIQEQLGAELARAQVRGQGVALALLDIDHFKYVNDTLGHGLGDELLKQAGARIASTLRAGDSVGRLAGDEFMIVIADIEGPITADRVCKRVMKAMSEPFHIDGDEIMLTVSLGLTVFPEDGDTTFEMFKNADMAVYEAKLKGRNQYCWYRASMKEKVTHRRRLGRELTSAIKQDQFSLLYQPIVNLKTGTVSKAEALIRWNHPQRGMIGPAEFISFAEDSGVIEDIGDWVFQTAASQAARWQEELDPDFQVSINMSPVQLRSDEAALKAWVEKMQAWNLPGRNLVVEITDGLLMDPGGTVSSWLDAFQKHGIEVALDDFGTGHSSLAYLKSFDIDYVKIDRSFVSALGTQTDERTLCEAIVVMAHRLGLKVIAEGVETREQHRFLVEAGCDYAQGFLLGKPVSPSQFGRFVQRPAM